MESKVKSQRKFYSVPDASDYLGGVVKPATIRQWIWRRQIDTVRIGRRVAIPQEALDRIIERGSVPAREVR
jgi:excisionase family DNA binding protein